MANVATVTFDIAAESAKLRSELDKVKKDVGQIKGVAKGLESGFKMVGGAIAGAFSVAAIGAFFGRVNDAANQLADMSTKLQASASGLQVLQIAAQQTGGSAEGMNKSLEKMTVTLGTAIQGNKAAVTAFDRLGLSVKDLAELKADQAFERIAGALEKIPNGYERAALAQTIFGKGSKEINGLLADGTAAIDGARAALEKQNAVLSDLDIARIDAMNDRLALQGTIVTNLGTKFLSGLTPAVDVAVDSLAGMLGKMGGATTAGETFGVVMTGAIKMVEAGLYGLAAVWESIRYVASAVMWGIAEAISRVIDLAATAAESMNLGIAGPLRDAATVADNISGALNNVATSAQQNAQAAAAAAVQAGKEVFQAATIFGQYKAQLDQQAAEAAGRNAADQGAYDPNAARNAQSKETERTGSFQLNKDLVNDKIVVDPMLTPEYLAQLNINTALEDLQDQHAQTMAGKIDAFEQTKLGSLLAYHDQTIAAEQYKNMTLGEMGNALATMAMQQGGSLGKIGKAYAIAQTIWSTGTAIMRAYAELGPIAGTGAAAMLAAQGAMQLASIKKTNVGGGGTLASRAGGVSGGASSPALSDNIGATKPQDTERTVTQVIIQGDVFSSQQTADWIIERISEAVNDRDTVFIAQGSRQAMELAGAGA